MPCEECVIIGDGPIIEEVKARLNKVASFRVQPFNVIYAKYQKDESSVTAEESQFVLRCAADIIDFDNAP